MKIAILDDYQDTIRTLNAFKKMAGQDVTIWKDHTKDVDTLAGRLKDTEVLVCIRERTPIRGPLLDRLDRLKMVTQVGVVVDTFHVWWDPDVWRQIARAGDRIASFQVCDWITPLPADTLLARGMMGDGHIDFPPLLAAVDAAGYTGDIEVEIFNADVWAADPDDVLGRLKDRYETLIAQWLT